MNRPPYYSEEVDKHIYNIPDGCKTVDDWIELALAAIDQAGFSAKSQNSISNLLNDMANQEKL